MYVIIVCGFLQFKINDKKKCFVLKNIFLSILLSDNNYTTGALSGRVFNMSRVTTSDIVGRKKLLFFRMTNETDPVMPPVLE